MKNIILLPFYFKKIGITLLISLFIVYLLLFVFKFDFTENQQAFLNQLMFSLACLALFFLNFYKRKNEDDSWILKRLHCLFFSVFLGINFYILNSLLNVLFQGDFYDIGAEILFFILLFNLVQMIGLNTTPKKTNDIE